MLLVTGALERNLVGLLSGTNFTLFCTECLYSSWHRARKVTFVAGSFIPGLSSTRSYLQIENAANYRNLAQRAGALRK